MRSLRKLLYGWVESRFLAGCSSYNPLSVRRRCRAKRQAREAFRELGLPHAVGTTFFWPWRALQFARRHGYPLVVKPDVSGFSRGSHFPLTTKGQLLWAALAVKVWWPISVVERYLEGANYRVLVTNDEIISVIRRYPPFVIGDGVATVGELIDRENRVREEMGLMPVIHPIGKGAVTRAHLQKNGFTLASVPARDQRVMLHNKIALAPGGVVEVVERATIHPDNQQMMLQLLRYFEANILGIDVIFAEGIETSWREQEAILLEVNSRPYLAMHDYPRYGSKEDLTPYLRRLDGLEIDERDLF